MSDMLQVLAVLSVLILFYFLVRICEKKEEQIKLMKLKSFYEEIDKKTKGT